MAPQRRFPFRLYGHRGAAAHEPENTLRAFMSALRGGANAIETDVRQTVDGEIVVFHDATGQRTCGVPELVAHVPWAAVRAWNAGHGEHPRRLDDVLRELPDVFVNVDIKDDDPRAAHATVAAVRRSGAAERVGLGSFHTRVARAVRAAGWRGQLALGVPEVAAARLLPRFAARWLVRGDAVQIPVSGYGIRLDRPAFIARCHALGLRVDFWTIDDPHVARALVRMGADGIVTNDPALIAAAL